MHGWRLKTSIFRKRRKRSEQCKPLGVPYEEGFDEKAIDDYMAQAEGIVADLKASGIETDAKKQIVAMIAYMHKLGRDISEQPTANEAVMSSASDTVQLKEVSLLESAEDLEAAEKIFQSTCVVCHGADGKGIATFPSLVDDEWINGNSPAQVFHSISEGNVAKGMVPYKTQYSEKQITQLTSYVLTTLQNK